MLAYTTAVYLERHGDMYAVSQWAYEHGCRMLPKGERVVVQGKPIFWGGDDCKRIRSSCDSFMLCVTIPVKLQGALPPCQWIYRHDLDGDLHDNVAD
jgi:hypothetical protein